MRAFILILVLGVLAGCTSYTLRHNDQPVLHTSCGIGGFNCVTETNDQVYPKARAKYGQMPGNLDEAFAVEEAVAVHQRTMNSTLFGGWGWNGLYAPQMPYGYRFVQPPIRRNYMAPAMTMPIGPFY